MAEKKLTLEQVAKYPRPGSSGPKRVDFSLDSRKITYLASENDSLVLQLWAYDIQSGERKKLTGVGASGPISREEELRRERNRTREVGVTSYQFSGEATTPTLLVPIGGSLFVQYAEGTLSEVPGSQGAVDARLSPDGTKIAFVRENELHLIDIATGELRKLTNGASEGFTNGLAEYVAQEEMGRGEGYWWSGDSQWLAYVQADSRHITEYPIVHQGLAKPEIEVHRFPFTGEANTKVKLGIVSNKGGDTTWLNLGQDEDIYLARVNWRPDGVLTAQVQTRDQRQLKLLAFNTHTGEATILMEDEGDPWTNLNNDLRFLKSGEFLWSSEKSGFRHLYLHDQNGAETRTLTKGEWVVTGVVAVDEANRLVYFQATRDGVTERHLYAVSLDGGGITRLTNEAGWHSVVISPDFSYMINTFTSLSQPPKFTLLKIDGTLVANLYQDSETNLASLDLIVPELFSFQSRDGVTLQAAIYNPANLEEGKRYPLIVSVYGGPHVQRVMNHWDLTVDLRCQYLAQEGYVVLKVDNRGTFNRGLAFEGALAGNMGSIEVQDQLDGVNFMAKRPYVDVKRVGVFGWSYGGYMTLMCMLRAPEVFKVGVSGAPVTHWDGYDTHYTERYMGLLTANPEGYQKTSPLALVGNLRGKLLLIHGMVDENVHFRHTARLIVALTAAQKPYDLMIYPEERHMPRNAKGLEYMERRITAYFKDNL